MSRKSDQQVMDDFFETRRYDKTPKDWKDDPDTVPDPNDEDDDEGEEVPVVKYNPDQPRDERGRFGSDGSSPPSKETVKEFSKKLDKIGKSRIAGGDQMKRDPDLKMILNKGREFDTSGVIKALGPDGECHWNVANLYRDGKIDAIAIGYAQTPSPRFGYGDDDNWHQHTWGVKNGRVVETTHSNVGNRAYFGVELGKADSKKFTAWAKKNPVGQGRVRRV